MQHLTAALKLSYVQNSQVHFSWSGSLSFPASLQIYPSLCILELLPPISFPLYNVGAWPRDATSSGLEQNFVSSASPNYYFLQNFLSLKRVSLWRLNWLLLLKGVGRWAFRVQVGSKSDEKQNDFCKAAWPIRVGLTFATSMMGYGKKRLNISARSSCVFPKNVVAYSNPKSKHSCTYWDERLQSFVMCIDVFWKSALRSTLTRGLYSMKSS